MAYGDACCRVANPLSLNSASVAFVKPVNHFSQKGRSVKTAAFYVLSRKKSVRA